MVRHFAKHLFQKEAGGLIPHQLPIFSCNEMVCFLYNVFLRQKTYKIVARLNFKKYLCSSSNKTWEI
jgi:hypothetical protein